MCTPWRSASHEPPAVDVPAAIEHETDRGFINRGCAPNPTPTLRGDPRSPTPRRRGAHVRAWRSASHEPPAVDVPAAIEHETDRGFINRGCAPNPTPTLRGDPRSPTPRRRRAGDQRLTNAHVPAPRARDRSRSIGAQRLTNRRPSMCQPPSSTRPIAASSIGAAPRTPRRRYAGTPEAPLRAGEARMCAPGVSRSLDRNRRPSMCQPPSSTRPIAASSIGAAPRTPRRRYAGTPEAPLRAGETRLAQRLTKRRPSMCQPPCTPIAAWGCAPNPTPTRTRGPPKPHSAPANAGDQRLTKRRCASRHRARDRSPQDRCDAPR